jgi:hypothetical protein
MKRGMNENIPEQALCSELSTLIEQARGTIVPSPTLP